jgi:hypothetical protein
MTQQPRAAAAERAPVGDPVPIRIAAYFAAVDGGRPDDAVEQFTPEALVALPPAGGHEVDPRRITRGRQEVRRLLGDRQAEGRRHELVLCVVEGAFCMVEGLFLDPTGEARTFVAAFRLDAAGRIERYLAFACEPAVALPPRADVPPSVPSARAAVEGYFHALDAGHFEEAADRFGAGVLYCHPPYRHTGITDNRRVDFNGREELLAAFRRRGRAVFSHRVLELIQRGPNALFEVVVEDLPYGGTGSAVCSLSLDDEGRIYRYVAFYTEPGVPQR